MRRAAKRVTGLSLGALSFVYLIFVLNPIQMMSVVFYPFSRPVFRGVNRWCARSIWGLWVLMAERFLGIEIRFTGDRIRPRENALVLPNHQSMADVMLAMCFAWRAGRLGDMKWFVKDVVKYVPGPGWGMKFLDCIFVKRDWARDRDGIHRTFAKYEEEGIPIFLVTFLEGTRKTDAKHARARAFAEERGHFVPDHTLVPRTKGFVATMIGLREHLDAVYDVTIGYHEHPAPTLVRCFEGRVDRVDVHIRRYAVADLPDTEEDLATWAFDRFREKDALLAHFAEHGIFPGEGWRAPVRVRDWLAPEARAVGS